MTKEEFKAKAKEVIDNEQYRDGEPLFDYESFDEMVVASFSDYDDSELGVPTNMPLDDFLDKLYEQIKGDLK